MILSAFERMEGGIGGMTDSCLEARDCARGEMLNHLEYQERNIHKQDSCTDKQTQINSIIIHSEVFQW